MKHIVYVLVFLALAGSALTSAFAQEAPVPRRMPRTPVNREALGGDHKAIIPPSHEIQGPAIIIDGERLRIGDFDLRLFGVVPPQLSASFGPQARTVLDDLTAGQNINCLIRDRDHEGRFLATCHNPANADLALELLRRGLAVTARGSVASTDLGATYIAAEQAAQTQKLGLWSAVVPSPAAIPDVTKPPVVATATGATITPSAVEQAMSKPAVAPPAAVPAPKSEPAPAKPSEPVVTKLKPSVAQVTDDIVANEASAAPEGPTFMMRYQLLITGLVLLATALGMLAAFSIQRVIDRRTEIRAIAAALRGELMAARAVCIGRLRAAAEIDDKDISWPRIRSTLYQAYVGRLGWLGAELARRVASIYGLASDYASYYEVGDETRETSMPKRQALQTLAQHIDDILPRLALIEQTGDRSTAKAGLARQAPIEPPPQRQTGTGHQMGTAVKASAGQVWGTLQDLARKSWKGKKAPKTQDPIAEYTALIEEEMKRFAFDEGEDDGSLPPANVTKLHG